MWKGNPALHGAVGDFAASDLVAALDGCDACEAPVIDEERNGWTVRGWGEDGAANPEPRPEMRLAPPMYDTRGFGGRIAIRDEVIVRALSLEPVQAVVDTEEGGSLADNDDYRLLAEHLDDQQALWVSLYPAEGGRLSASGEDEIAAAVRDAGGEYLGPFLTWAVGRGYDSSTGREYNILVLVHETPEQAEANAALLADRLTPALEAARATGMGEFGHDEDSIIEVETDGRVLTATIRGTAESLGGNDGQFIRFLLASE